MNWNVEPTNGCQGAINFWHTRTDTEVVVKQVSYIRHGYIYQQTKTENQFDGPCRPCFATSTNIP